MSPGGGGTPLPTFIYLFIMNDRILELYCSVDEPQHLAAFAVVRKLPGNWTFRSQDHSLPRAKVPDVELSLPGTFVP